MRSGDDSLGEGLAMLQLVSISPRKAVTWLHSCLEFMVKCSKRLAPRFAALSRCLCFDASEWGSTLVPASTFVPTEAMPPLPSALQEGELFLPQWPRGSSDHAVHSQASALLPHRSTAMASRLHQAGAGTSKTSDFELSASKILPLVFPVSGFGEVFLLCNPQGAVFHLYL